MQKDRQKPQLFDRGRGEMATPDDIAAAEELALELNMFEGAKFLRSEVGCGLRAAIDKCWWLGEQHPDTPLGISVRRQAEIERARKAS
jgi:hypothetical protein